MAALPDPSKKAFAFTQAAWRFFQNENVTPEVLAEPLRRAARQADDNRKVEWEGKSRSLPHVVMMLARRQEFRPIKTLEFEGKTVTQHVAEVMGWKVGNKKAARRSSNACWWPQWPAFWFGVCNAIPA